MIELKQRFPNSVSGGTPQIYTFASMEEFSIFMLYPPKGCFINNWRNQSGFDYFKIIKRNGGQDLLACYAKDSSYWMIAYLKDIK